MRVENTSHVGSIHGNSVKSDLTSGTPGNGSQGLDLTGHATLCEVSAETGQQRGFDGS